MTQLSKAQKKLNFKSNYLAKFVLGSIKDQKKLAAFIAKDSRKRLVPSPRMSLEEAELGGVPVMYCSEGDFRDDITLLYLHGGAYTVGGYDDYKCFAAHLAGKTGLRVVLADYTLATEAPYPAAVNDAEAVYKALLHQGQKVVIAGDSAGGGLSFALLHRISQTKLLKPVCMVGLSVWADLTLTAKAIRDNRKTELMLPLKWLTRARDLYARATSPKHPELSPIYGEFTAPPPVLLLVGAGEILRDDTHNLKTRLHYFDGHVDVIERTGLPHIWPVNFGQSPEADQAVGEITEFIKHYLTEPM